MIKLSPLGMLVTFLGGQWAFAQFYQQWEKDVVTREAYKYAESVGKPVLDFGCGTHPRGDYNVDVVPRTAKNFIKIQAFGDPRLPFNDKEFGAAICFHVLEHVNNPGNVMDELSRVSEGVFIITPHPFYWRTWVNPEHKWIFVGNTYFTNPFYPSPEALDDNPFLYPE